MNMCVCYTDSRVYADAVCVTQMVYPGQPVDVTFVFTPPISEQPPYDDTFLEDNGCGMPVGYAPRVPGRVLRARERSD